MANVWCKVILPRSASCPGSCLAFVSDPFPKSGFIAFQQFPDSPSPLGEVLLCSEEPAYLCCMQLSTLADPPAAWPFPFSPVPPLSPF